MEGKPYGYHNMIFSWIATTSGNYPPPLDSHLVETDGSSTIPPSVLHILNSKACMGAIMFGDSLLPSECSLIMEELKGTSLCLQVFVDHISYRRPGNPYSDAHSAFDDNQGVEPATTYENLGLPSEWYRALEWVFPEWARRHALDKGEAFNILKGAIVTADRIATVSQGYAWEITTVEGGSGLNEILSARKGVLNGITNGIVVNEWDPATDKHLPSHYSVNDLSGKASM